MPYNERAQLILMMLAKDLREKGWKGHLQINEVIEGVQEISADVIMKLKIPTGDFKEKEEGALTAGRDFRKELRKTK